MALLVPSLLETIEYRMQGWNGILTTNAQRMNTFLTKLWGPTQATYNLGDTAVTDGTALTQNDLTDSSTGTPSATNDIVAISGSGDDTNLCDNFATMAAELALVKADNAVLLAKVNELLATLRTINGCGILT